LQSLGRDEVFSALDREDRLAQLNPGGRNMNALRQAIKEDGQLLDAASTAFILSLFVVTYGHVRNRADIPLVTADQKWQRQLVKDYLRQALRHRPALDYSKEDFARTLGWLGVLLQGGKTLYLEHLQKRSLPAGEPRRVYRRLTWWMTCLLIPVALLALGIGAKVAPMCVLGILIGAVLAAALAGFVTVGWRGEETEDEVDVDPIAGVRWSWLDVAARLQDRFGIGPLAGAIIMLIFGLTAGFVAAWTIWSAYGLIEGVLAGLSAGFGVALIAMVVAALFGGLQRQYRGEEDFRRPNGSIWRSVQIGVTIGTLLGLFAGLVFGLLFWVGVAEQNTDLAASVTFGAGVALGLGVIAAFRFGCLAAVRHFRLRLALQLAGIVPWRFVRFLNEANDIALLERAGRGYRFINQLLGDYFAKGWLTDRENG